MQNELFWRYCERGDLTCVQEAIRGGNIELNWCMEGAPYNVCFMCKRCMLSADTGSEQVMHKPVHVVQMHKNDLFLLYIQGCTPLHIAVVHGHEQVVMELLHSGANPNTFCDVSYSK